MSLRRIPLLLLFVRLATAQLDENVNNQRRVPSSAAIGIVVAAAFLFLCCCGIQRRRARRAVKPPWVPPPLPLTSASRFPHGLQYGTPQTSYAPPPGPYTPYNAPSEYPSAGAADFAPPPYVKDSGAYAPPPGPPPPPIDAVQAPVYMYSPPPGPPPQAHISHHSGDFSGGFRPPPPSS